MNKTIYIFILLLSYFSFIISVLFSNLDYHLKFILLFGLNSILFPIIINDINLSNDILRVRMRKNDKKNY
jgi:hypothetical protein